MKKLIILLVVAFSIYSVNAQRNVELRNFSKSRIKTSTFPTERPAPNTEKQRAASQFSKVVKSQFSGNTIYSNSAKNGGADLFACRVYEGQNNVMNIIGFNSDDPSQASTVMSSITGQSQYVSYYLCASYAEGYLYLQSAWTRADNGTIGGPEEWFKISVEDWTVTSSVVDDTYEYIVNEMSYNPATGVMYAVSLDFENEGSILHTINLTTGSYTPIGFIDEYLVGLAFDADGQLYGLAVEINADSQVSNTTLGTIDLSTRAFTTIGSTGYNPRFSYQSMTFDYGTGNLYWETPTEAGTLLLEIDTQTGTATQDGNIGTANVIAGMFSTSESTIVESTIPANNAENIQVTTPVSVTFTQNVTAGTLTDITITPDPGNVSANIINNVLTITHDDLDYNTTYTLTVPTTAVNELVSDLTWSFTTMQDPNACNDPSNLAAVPDVFTAVLTWTENGIGESWDVLYGEAGFDVLTEGTLVDNLTAQTTTLTNLDDNTYYDFYVRAICPSSSEQTEWVGPFNFRTIIDCSESMTIPWSENFDNFDVTANCWNLYSVAGEDWELVYLDEAQTDIVFAQGLLEEEGDIDAWLVTPKLSIPSNTSVNPALTFMSYFYYAADYDKSSILVSTEGNDPSVNTFTEVWSPESIVDSYEEVVILLSDYAGQDIYVAFKYEGNYSHIWAVNDVNLIDFQRVDARMMSIVTPETGVNMTNQEQVKVVVNNNGAQSITGFTLKLEVDGTEIVTETYNGTIASFAEAEYTFNQTIDLSADGEYEIKVTVNLANDAIADNDTITKTVSNTICNTITTFPWTENFEAGLTPCWTRIDADGDGFNWRAVTIDGIGSVVVSESFYALIPGFLETPLTPDNYLISPQIALTSDEYELSFSVGAVNSTYFAENYSVMISTTGTDASDFTAIHTETLTSGTMKTVALSLVNYSGENIYIAFRHHDCTDEYALIVTNIQVVKLDPIAVGSYSPANNATNVAMNAPVSVTFNRNNITIQNLDQITISPALTGVSASVDGGAITIAHDNFEYETEYTVTIPVGVVTGYGEEISWSFTTANAPAAPVLSPVNGAVGVALNAEVSATFEFNITAGNLSSITISPEVNGVTANVEGSMLIIAHDDFAYETEYTVTIPAGTIANYNREISWSFTTIEDVSVPESKIGAVSIYPNPSNGLVNITVADNSVVKVLDLTGKVINTYDVNANTTLNFNQSAGMYFINVESNGETSTHKLIIQ